MSALSCLRIFFRKYSDEIVLVSAVRVKLLEIPNV
jgi:hypothetical protein